MKLAKTLTALRLAKQLEESGMASLMMPPVNFMLSPKIDPKLIPAAEQALAVYKRICVWMLRVTAAAKFASLVAVVGILVKAWL